MEGLITNIQRFSTHDGPGVRTTVFLKGCSLHCFWCHNPETIRPAQQLYYYEENCTGCGKCVISCVKGLHRFKGGSHVYSREDCDACGDCARACLYDALCLAAQKYSAQQVLEIVKKDLDYYKSTGGGMTISGGEPMMQPAFTAEILRLARGQGIHTALDTAAHVERENFELVLPYTDLVLLDIKTMDPAVHKRATGQENRRVLENARWLSEQPVDVIVRIPVIPGINDNEENMRQTAEFLKDFRNLAYVELLPYHDLGTQKHLRLTGIPLDNSIKPPEQAQLALLAKPFEQRAVCIKI